MASPETFQSAVLKAWFSGRLKEKIRDARDHLTDCCLCPRQCHVNRLDGQRGFCRQGASARIARALPHFGEEPPLSGNQGSGTVFFSGCALRCRYCQNYQISQQNLGEDRSPEELAGLFLDLQHQGCHNLNLVSPTPHLPFILSALEIAAGRGLHLPLVYNTHGYLSPATLDLLEGIVDIYLPDMKYAVAETGVRFSQVGDYPLYNQEAIKVMFHQVGPLLVDGRGIAQRGLLVRHLILPDHLFNSKEILKTLAGFSLKISLSLMSQYRPCFRSAHFPEINRRLLPWEYEEVLDLARELGFEDIFTQDLDSSGFYFPDFRQGDPFAG
ncbi:MAG: radical SAM protein [Thermodesulfobacteriota bacterium]